MDSPVDGCYLYRSPESSGTSMHPSSINPQDRPIALCPPYVGSHGDDVWDSGMFAALEDETTVASQRRQRSFRRLGQDEWMEFKDRVGDLYLKQKRPLRDVRRVMEDHGFSAS